MTRSGLRRRSIGRLACGVGLVLSACGTSGPPASDDAAIDPAIYSRVDDPTDPYASKYAEFRARRARDMADPSTPRPLERVPARHVSRDEPWGDPEVLLPFDWAKVRRERPDRVEALLEALRVRLVFDHPDLEIRQLMLGPGARLPAWSEAAPGVFVVIGGRGVIQVEDLAWRVTTGTTVKLEPGHARRLRADEDGALRIVWVRWAPGGDQAYVDAGYYLTGANQHVQPSQARFEDGYRFWGPVDGGFGPVAAEPIARPSPPPPIYPQVPVFGHESRIPWLSAETLKAGGFFFSDDLGSLLEVADEMIRIARHKAIFRATRPDGRWDFNLSESAWGPRSTYVEHSHVIPEFYYVLSGPVIYGVDGERYESMPGDVLFNNSYSPHLAQGIVDGLVFRSFSSTFAPKGDRSVFDRPFVLHERLPEQPSGARLPDDVRFH